MQVKHSNRDLALLYSLMRMCRCLLANQNLRVELYVSDRKCLALVSNLC